MKAYWTLESIPELTGLPLSEKQEAIKACRWLIFKHWKTWIAAGFIILIGIVGQLVGLWIGSALGNGWKYLLPMLGGLLGLLPGWIFFFSVTAIEQMRPHLREYIEQH